ncbi:MAG: hypothetical protein V4480_01800 [Patescibacteria group bacterium]
MRPSNPPRKYFSVHAELTARLESETYPINTLEEYRAYADSIPYSEVGRIIVEAIDRITLPLRNPDGSPDRKAIYERRKLFKGGSLPLSAEIDLNVFAALSNTLEKRTGEFAAFGEAAKQSSFREYGTSTPLELAHDITNMVSRRIFENSSVRARNLLPDGLR